MSRTNIEEAVKHPDDYQHVMTEGMPMETRDISLFMKRIMSREANRRHWLLVQSHRVGIDQRVGAAWRVFPADVNIEAALHPLDVLKAFVQVFGFPIKVGEMIQGTFIESELHEDRLIEVDVSSRA